MSDDEYEYEYDEDASMEQNEAEEEEQFEYTDEEEPADDIQVELENLYYNSKGLRETNLEEAKRSFEQVIQQESQELSKGNEKKYGPWSYKAMKQLVKLHLRVGDADAVQKDYSRLLECIASGGVSPNQIEKGLNAMLERVASLYQGNIYGSASTTGDSSKMDPRAMALQVYDSTLQTFHPKTGSGQNERLWFKTNIKYGQLLYEMNETPKLHRVLHDLQSYSSSTMMAGAQPAESSYSAMQSSSSTQSMEIYALQIQLYSRQRDHKNLRQTFEKAMAVRGGIPHPRTLALIQELGGKMHMESKQYEAAGKTFFQAFKSYDEAGDPARLKCLQYLVLASMLGTSSINPFDSQEARPYRDDPEIVAMTNLVQAFHSHDIHSFEKILLSPQGKRMLKHDEFIRLHLTDLLRTIRTQVLQKVLRPYSRVSLAALASHHLNNITVSEVESLLVQLILDGTLQAKIDKTDGVLLLDAKQKKKSSGSASYGGSEDQEDYAARQVQAMQILLSEIEKVSIHATSMKIKDGPAMLGTMVSSGTTTAVGGASMGGFRGGMVH
ncbi:hypothetical protein ACA910_010794 [Epithemia clementina (nom. ined.)]